MSTIEERSPKRQRTSYSPASPPLAELKQYDHEQALHTPPPSVHMSPSWQSQNIPAANSVDSTIPPTPTSTSQGIKDEVVDGVDTPAQESQTEGDVEMTDSEHRRTDHDRIGDEAGDLPPPPLLYKFDAEPVELLQPDPSQDLFDLYSLQAVQRSVRRRDSTGAKVNKLRKSYESKSRNLGVEGRNKATVQEGHLQGLVDPDWDTPVAENATLWTQKLENVTFSAEGADKILADLERVLKMRAGRLPRAEHNEWRSQLGLDDAAPSAKGSAPLISPVDSIARTSAAAAIRSSAPSSPNGTIRPDRAGKKRRYDESSYEGYDDDGDSTGGVDNRLGARRVKRKVSGI